ncbi:MAG TPA: hypothetical protein ENJ31_04805 [Anaerolineae bacterium]|nr:hypothetical protein [Anaerolineae bacterium]
MGLRLTVDYFNGSLDLYVEDALKKNPALRRVYLTEGFSADRTAEGQLVAFESHLFDDYYQRIKRQLANLSLRDRYDVPEAGLRDASLQDVLDWVYRHHVLGRQRVALRRQVAAVAS